MFRKIMLAGLLAVMLAGASIGSAAKDFLLNREKSSAVVSQERETTEAVLEEGAADTVNQKSTEEETINKETVNKETINKETINKETVNKETDGNSRGLIDSNGDGICDVWCENNPYCNYAEHHGNNSYGNTHNSECNFIDNNGDGICDVQCENNPYCNYVNNNQGVNTDSSHHGYYSNNTSNSSHGHGRGHCR